MDISLYTDGEQATAAVLNRPLQQIKGAVDTIENSNIIKDTTYTRQWTGERTDYQLSGYHKDYYYPIIFKFSTYYNSDPADIWIGRAGVHGVHNSSWSENSLSWFCHESYFVRNLYNYGWGHASPLRLEVDKYELNRNKNLLGAIDQSSGTGTYGILWIRGGIFHYIKGVKNAPRASDYIYNYDLWGDVEPDLSPLRQRITIEQSDSEQIVDIQRNMHVYTRDNLYYKSRKNQKEIDLSVEDFTTDLWEEADIGTRPSRTRYELHKEVQIVSPAVDEIVKTLESTYYKCLVAQTDIDISVENFGDTTNWESIEAEDVETINYTVNKETQSVNLHKDNYVRDYNSKFYKSKITEDSVDLALEDLSNTNRWEDLETTSTEYVDIPAWKDQYGHRYYPKHYSEIHGGIDACDIIRNSPHRRKIWSGLNKFSTDNLKQSTAVMSTPTKGKYFRIGYIGDQYLSRATKFNVRIHRNSYVSNLVLEPYCAAYGYGDDYMGNVARALYKKWGSSSDSLKAYIDIKSGYIYIIVEDDGNKVSQLAEDKLVSCAVHNVDESFKPMVISDYYMNEIRGNLREFTDIIAENE